MSLRIRSSAVCLYQKSVLVFKAIDPSTQKVYLFLPGGKIESGESSFDCAERETFEETGYRIKVKRDSEIIKHYVHEWNGSDHHCKTYFYLAELNEEWHEPRPVKDANYNIASFWLETQKIKDAFGYNQEIFDAVKNLIGR